MVELGDGDEANNREGNDDDVARWLRESRDELAELLAGESRGEEGVFRGTGQASSRLCAGGTWGGRQLGP